MKKLLGGTLALALASFAVAAPQVAADPNAPVQTGKKHHRKTSGKKHHKNQALTNTAQPAGK